MGGAFEGTCRRPLRILCTLRPKAREESEGVGITASGPTGSWLALAGGSGSTVDLATGDSLPIDSFLRGVARATDIPLGDVRLLAAGARLAGGRFEILRRLG